MGKNLLGKLRRNKDIECVHELFEGLFFGAEVLDFRERAKESYEKVKNTVKNVYSQFKSYIKN